MGRDDRQKASDVFRETNYVFGEKVSFEKAFPEIADLKIRVREEGRDIAEWNRERYFGKNIGEFVDCSNRSCYNGGFSIAGIVREMVRTREEHRETTEFCRGNEGSPKGRRIYSKCMNRFVVAIDIQFVETDKREDD